MHVIFKTASFLILVAGLSACVSPTTTRVHINYSGGGSGGSATAQTSVHESVAETQATSGEQNPGETSGPEGTTDSGGGTGFGSFSG